jgi:hypothetical protein
MGFIVLTSVYVRGRGVESQGSGEGGSEEGGEGMTARKGGELRRAGRIQARAARIRGASGGGRHRRAGAKDVRRGPGGSIVGSRSGSRRLGIDAGRESMLSLVVAPPGGGWSDREGGR